MEPKEAFARIEQVTGTDSFFRSAEQRKKNTLRRNIAKSIRSIQNFLRLYNETYRDALHSVFKRDPNVDRFVAQIVVNSHEHLEALEKLDKIFQKEIAIIQSRVDPQERFREYMHVVLIEEEPLIQRFIRPPAAVLTISQQLAKFTNNLELNIEAYAKSMNIVKDIVYLSAALCIGILTTSLNADDLNSVYKYSLETINHLSFTSIAMLMTKRQNQIIHVILESME